MKDTFTLVVQPRADGSKAQDETKVLPERLGWDKKVATVKYIEPVWFRPV